MSNTITYQYARPSALQARGRHEELFLSQYSEVQKKEAACFFWGKLNNSFTTARCLLTLSQVVQSSFNLSPFQRSLLKDPVVTAGNGKIRFEGFSHCAGVYARVDVLPEGHDGEFPENGTTNVDFNQAMLSALSSVTRREEVVLSVGRQEVALHRNDQKVVERKVPLPAKWIKGLTTVQRYLADTEPVATLSRTQALQLIRSIPRQKSRTPHHLVRRGGRVMFSPVAGTPVADTPVASGSFSSTEGISIGGLHRLRLLDPLLPLADELRIFAHAQGQSTTWQLYFGPIRFSLTLSKDSWRGFSGEGAALDSLVAEVPDRWIQHFDQYSYCNQEFNPTLLAVQENLSPQRIQQLSAHLSAMGLLGYDLDENHFFYRRLPFKLDRIRSLNPRLKSAEKLLAEEQVAIVSQDDHRTEAKVVGSGVTHTVVLSPEQERCTCTWFSQHQGERGPCKHILATKKQTNEPTKLSLS